MWRPDRNVEGTGHLRFKHRIQLMPGCIDKARPEGFGQQQAGFVDTVVIRVFGAPKPVKMLLFKG